MIEGFITRHPNGTTSIVLSAHTASFQAYFKSAIANPDGSVAIYQMTSDHEPSTIWLSDEEVKALRYFLKTVDCQDSTKKE